MATFALIPGAGGSPAYWSPVVTELERRGHTAIAVDIPQQDESTGIEDHVQTVVDAIAADRAADGPLVVVALSMGAYIAPLACSRLPVDLLVLLNAMIPSPGETASEWWEATRQGEARRAAGWEGFDLLRDFFHDVPKDLTDALKGDDREPSERSFAEPWPAAAWPDVPTVVLAGEDDRVFPVAFQQRVAQERLGLTAQVLPGGHLLPLSRPVELADRLEALTRTPRLDQNPRVQL